MPMLQTTIEAGRVGLKKLYAVESANVPDQWKSVVGNDMTTNQTFERIAQYAGLGPAIYTPEGDDSAQDQMYPIFARNYTPVLYTKRVEYSKQTKFTDQYKAFTDMMPKLSRAFVHAKNQAAANMDNLGFTDTTYGMNSETLYSTSHSMGTGNPTFSNRPATDISLSPIALEQALTELRLQKSARNTPQPVLGQVLLKVHPSREPLMYRILNSMLQAQTTDNDANYVKTRVKGFVCDYFTSTTAWFLRSTDNTEHGLFLLQQLPFDVEIMAMQKNLMYPWVASESYTVGWFDAHATWGTTG